ncbi:hypothetical protein LEP1GSC112_2050 [Leptospira interrogans serovar Pomona str. UT364]|nr:hypothetical protein LEP1GSC112_2050 [Leptospira interrogans serovar Pomona str. UT364]
MLKICKRSIFGITRKGSDARELKQNASEYNFALYDREIGRVFIKVF